MVLSDMTEPSSDTTSVWVAVSQPNYIPWKGYFDLIQKVGHFVLLDSVQYTRRDWRNRNLIKTPSGLKWLTIPVKVSGLYYQRIDETEVISNEWCEQHWSLIQQYYRNAPFFSENAAFIQTLYEQATGLRRLTDINSLFIRDICQRIGIQTAITNSSDYSLVEGKNHRLVHLCKQLNATHYLSGPAAKSYLKPELFIRYDIKVRYMNYDYPEYHQLYSPFEHGVTILDTLFNEDNVLDKVTGSVSKVV